MTPCPHRLAIAALLLAQPTWAAEPLDPTRPPTTQTPAPPVVALPTGGDRAAGSAGDAASSELVLQSLQLPRSGDATAIISGRLYRVGDRIGAETITRIDAHGVVLKGPSATRGLTPYGVLALNIEPAPRVRTAQAPRQPAPLPASEATTQVRVPVRPAPASAARPRSVALLTRGALSLRLDLGDDSPATPLRPAAPARLQAGVAPQRLPALPVERAMPPRPVTLSAALASAGFSPQAGVFPARFPFSPPMAGSVPR